MTPDDRAYAVEAFRGLASTTIDVYARELVALAGHGNVRAWCDALLSGPQGDAVGLAWQVRGAMLDRQLAPSTVSLRIAVLRSLCARARMVGRIAWSLSVPGLRAAPRHYGITALDVSYLLGDALAGGPGDAIGIRDFAILRCLFDLGLRASELVGLDLADVKLARATIAIRGKGAHGARVVRQLAPRTLDAIERWIAVRSWFPPPCEALWCSYTLRGRTLGRLTARGLAGALARRSARACGRRVSPHAIRHASITCALDRGISPRDVATHSRHRDLRTLQAYDDSRRDPSGEISALISELASPRDRPLVSDGRQLVFPVV